jgi:DICT domain-containing protein
MGLGEFIEFVQECHTEIVLFNLDPGDEIAADLATGLETWNVTIETARTASGTPRNVAVLSTDGQMRSVVDVTPLRQLFEDGSPSDATGTDAEYEEVLRHIKETTFISGDTRYLRCTCREIEDRALRVGRGTIYSGFQEFSRMADQESFYTDLARHGVTVQAFGVPDVEAPDFGSGRVHAIETEEIARWWFVVFDGRGDDTQKSGLLAQEQDPDSFEGIWTYDPGLVDRIVEYLERTYVRVSPETDTFSQSR